MVVLTLKAKNDHLQKVAKTSDFVKALAELVWNSLDADATEVNVIFSLNALGGIDSIVVTDNGSGISKERAEHDFESLGDSWKRTWRRFYLVMWTLLSQLSSCLERRNTSFS